MCIVTPTSDRRWYSWKCPGHIRHTEFAPWMLEFMNLKLPIYNKILLIAVSNAFAFLSLSFSTLLQKSLCPLASCCNMAPGEQWIILLLFLNYRPNEAFKLIHMHLIMSSFEKLGKLWFVTYWKFHELQIPKCSVLRSNYWRWLYSGPSEITGAGDTVFSLMREVTWLKIHDLGFTLTEQSKKSQRRQYLG